MNVHPGARAALRMLNADELDVAEMMRDGDLTSPQFVGNMALFKLRVSGVGYAYRPKHDEYVYRRPEHYLTERFLQRVGGLPVIWEHPDKAVLTSSEFFKRSVGSLMLPYIDQGEVWAIARIYDKDAAREMAQGELSTSPSVVFRDPATNLRIETDDGKTLLVEGPASLVDHVAICANGVWDKGEAPDGVLAEGDAQELGAAALERMADSIDELGDRVNTLLIYDRLARLAPRTKQPLVAEGARHGR